MQHTQTTDILLPNVRFHSSAQPGFVTACAYRLLFLFTQAMEDSSYSLSPEGNVLERQSYTWEQTKRCMGRSSKENVIFLQSLGWLTFFPSNCTTCNKRSGVRIGALALHFLLCSTQKKKAHIRPRCQCVDSKPLWHFSSKEQMSCNQLVKYQIIGQAGKNWVVTTRWFLVTSLTSFWVQSRCRCGVR